MSTEPRTESNRILELNWREGFGAVWIPFLLSRMWVAFFAYWGHSQRPYLKPVEGGWAGVDNWWLNPWTTYDAERFVKIAERGYDIVTSVAFPLYSLLLMPFGSSRIAMAAWGVFISNGSFLLGLTVLYLLTKRDFGLTVAKGTIWATAFFPASVIFSAVYSESLFLLLTALMFWNARSNRWAWAGIWGFFAGLTRTFGPVLFVALLVEVWMRRRKDKHAVSPLAYVGAFGPIIAFGLFQLYLRNEFGRGDLVTHQAHNLGRTWMLPWIPLWRETMAILVENHIEVATLTNYWATLTGVIFIFAYWKKGRFSYSVHLLGTLMLHLCYGLTYAPYTIGGVRYLAGTFPMNQRLSLFMVNNCKTRLSRILILLLALWASAIVAFLFGKKFYLF